MLELDATFLPSPEIDAARRVVFEYQRELGTCWESHTRPETRAGCAVNTLLASGELKPAGRPAEPEANTLTHVLVHREGSCAALVAVVLALTEPHGEPLEATIFRDHVVLSVRGRAGLYFEALKGGRRLSVGELKAFPAPPGGPETVRGAHYVAYYLDNLAARLAEAGRPAEAERAFKRALDIAHRSGRTHYNYGTLLLKLGRADEALPHLRRAIRLGWDDAPAWTNRGVASWKLGQTRAARRCFKRALRIDPGSREAAENLRRLEGESRTARQR